MNIQNYHGEELEKRIKWFNEEYTMLLLAYQRHGMFKLNIINMGMCRDNACKYCGEYESFDYKLDNLHILEKCRNCIRRDKKIDKIWNEEVISSYIQFIPYEVLEEVKLCVRN